jgi:hypothetical protein
MVALSFENVRLPATWVADPPKAMFAKLRRPWFAGGTVRIASVQGDGHYLAEDATAFEDGTVNYLGVPAVGIGLRHLSDIGIDVIHERVRCLTGWLLESLAGLRHSDGRPCARIHGPSDLNARGGAIAFNLLDVNGELRHRTDRGDGESASISFARAACNPAWEDRLRHGLIEIASTSETRGTHLRRASLPDPVGAREGRGSRRIPCLVTIPDTDSSVRRIFGKTAEEVGWANGGRRADPEAAVSRPRCQPATPRETPGELPAMVKPVAPPRGDATLSAIALACVGATAIGVGAARAPDSLARAPWGASWSATIGVLCGPRHEAKVTMELGVGEEIKLRSRGDAPVNGAPA